MFIKIKGEMSLNTEQNLKNNNHKFFLDCDQLSSFSEAEMKYNANIM